MAAISVQNFVVCQQAVNPCPPELQTMVPGLAIDPAYLSALTALLDTGGVDLVAAAEAFGGGLLLFGAGAGVGLVINVLRKLRTP